MLTSAAELRRITATWSARPATVLGPTATGVGAALDVFAASDIVHVAAHGVRTAGDGRFAQLVLGDGDLTAFDLERLPTAAALVVLSACEAGLVDTLPGEESIGLATALFDRGCDTIVAGTLPLPDAAPTADVFGRIHELLAARIPPAEALFTAQAELGATAEGLVARLGQLLRPRSSRNQAEICSAPSSATTRSRARCPAGVGMRNHPRSSTATASTASSVSIDIVPPCHGSIEPIRKSRSKVISIVCAVDLNRNGAAASPGPRTATAASSTSATTNDTSPAVRHRSRSAARSTTSSGTWSTAA